MKTAEEWNEIKESNPLDKDVELLKQIQLDAMKEGMRRAAEICTPSNDHQYRVWLHDAQAENKKAILTAAEQLTTKDIS